MAWRDIPGAVWLASHWRAIVLTLLIGTIGLFVWRPFDRIDDPTGDDIAVAWNESIGRLGITPVYPPTEDLSVGDVWAFVAEIDKGSEARELNSTPLLGKAVRIGHIDLRAQILMAAKHPTFADTVGPAAELKLPKQDRWEIPLPADDTKGRIPLSLTAFPGVTISHQSRTGAQIAGSAGWFGAQRQRERQEQILIKSAESYGIPTTAAVFFLNGWCKDNELCQDANVRKILSYTVGEEVLQTAGSPKKYTSRLGVQLVTRVFLMRQIEHRRSNDDARGAAIQVGDVKADAGGNAGNSPGQGNTAINGVTQNLSPGTNNGGRLSQVSGDGLTLSMTETFQRPVAFGYRSVTISLDPSEPKERK